MVAKRQRLVPVRLQHRARGPAAAAAGTWAGRTGPAGTAAGRAKQPISAPQLGAVAAVGRHPDDHVGLAALAGAAAARTPASSTLNGRDALRAGQLPHRSAESGRQRAPSGIRRRPARRRPRFGRSAAPAAAAGRAAAPASTSCPARPRRCPASPAGGGVVGELHRQRRQRRRAAPALSAGVQRRRARPGRCSTRCCRRRCGACRRAGTCSSARQPQQAQPAAADRRPGRSGAPRGVGSRAAHRSRRVAAASAGEVVRLEPAVRRRRGRTGFGAPAPLDERGTQHLVPAHDVGDRPPQRGLVEVAAQHGGEAGVVPDGVVVELASAQSRCWVEDATGFAPGGAGGSGSTAGAPTSSSTRGELFDRRVGEQGVQRRSRGRTRPCTRDSRLGGQQRVAAEGEEVGRHADLVEAQRCAPQRRPAAPRSGCAARPTSSDATAAAPPARDPFRDRGRGAATARRCSSLRSDTDRHAGPRPPRPGRVEHPDVGQEPAQLIPGRVGTASATASGCRRRTASTTAGSGSSTSRPRRRADSACAWPGRRDRVRQQPGAAGRRSIRQPPGSIEHLPARSGRSRRHSSRAASVPSAAKYSAVYGTWPSASARRVVRSPTRIPPSCSAAQTRCTPATSRRSTASRSSSRANSAATVRSTRETRGQTHQEQRCGVRRRYARTRGLQVRHGRRPAASAGLTGLRWRSQSSQRTRHTVAGLVAAGKQVGDQAARTRPGQWSRPACAGSAARTPAARAPGRR